MTTIYKYELNDEQGVQVISMPIGAKVLSVYPFLGKRCIWALVDTDAEKENRTFEVCEMGEPIEDRVRKYIGTFQLHGGSLVFHLFENL